MAYLVDNIEIEPLIPYLLSCNVLCDVTKPYVTAPLTIDQRVNRLVDVLITKEKGLFDFTEVLQKCGLKSVADELSGKKIQIYYV